MSMWAGFIICLAAVVGVVSCYTVYSRANARGRRDALSQLLNTVEAVPVAMTVLDSELRVLCSNRAARSVLQQLPTPLRELAATVLVTGRPAIGPVVSGSDGPWTTVAKPITAGALGNLVAVIAVPETSVAQANSTAAGEPVRALSGQLILAQEAERTRIARHLHDEVNQDLATLAIHLSSLKRRIPDGLPECRSEVEFLQKAAMQVSEHIRTLSHELHPGVLRHVGLSAALRAHCIEFSRGHQIDIRYADTCGAVTLSSDVQTCLYRVGQEAMSNIARHAQATQAAVTLSRGAKTLELRIVDNGRGFNPQSVGNEKGLGLVSMDERVRLIGGRILLLARAGAGTDLCVVIPLPGETHVEDYAAAGG